MCDRVSVCPLPPYRVTVQGAHDISDLGLAAARKRECLEPLFHLNCLHIDEAVRPPARKNPLLQISLVGLLRRKCFSVLFRLVVGWRRLVEDVRQFVLSVMLDQRGNADLLRSEEHTSELQSHSFISYAVFCLK